MVDKIYYDAVNVLEHCWYGLCNEIFGINDENQSNSKMIGLVPVNTRFKIDIAQAHSKQNSLK